jgi:hypothetical protein
VSKPCIGLGYAHLSRRTRSEYYRLSRTQRSELDGPQPSTWQHCEMSSKVGRRVRHAPYFFQMSRSPCAFRLKPALHHQVLASSSSSTKDEVHLLRYAGVSIHRLLRIQKHLYTPCVGYLNLVVHTIHSTITPTNMQQHRLLTDSGDLVGGSNTTSDYVVESTSFYSVRWPNKQMHIQNIRQRKSSALKWRNTGSS